MKKYHFFDDEDDGMKIITLEVMPDSMETVPYDSFCPDMQQNNTSNEEINDQSQIACDEDVNDQSQMACDEDVNDQNQMACDDDVNDQGQMVCDEDVKDQSEMAFHVDKNEETDMPLLTDKNETDVNENCEEASKALNIRTDLLEYTTNSDGSVCCKTCGKILPSRTHWYRHKYRAHVIHPLNPGPLFQCEQCLIYFKSRKGYIGHIASKHSETLQDVSPVLTNAQAEALAKEKSKIQPLQPIKILPKPPKPEELALTQAIPAMAEVKREPDPEQSIPITVVPTFQRLTVRTMSRSTETPQRRTRSTRQGLARHMGALEQQNVNNAEWRAKRSREDKLVADIIARVRRECEAQGSGGSARRGYSRKSGLHT